MTGRDRIVMIVVVVAVRCSAAAWVLVVSPERKQASALGSAGRSAPSRSSRAPKARSRARARAAQYATAYASIVSLGKAVPPSQEVPSLIYQLAQASEPEERRILLDHLGRSAAPAASSTLAARRRAPPRLAAGFTQLPFTFVFKGSFFDLEHLFSQLDGLRDADHRRRPRGQRAPADDPERRAWHRPGTNRASAASELTGYDHRHRLRAARQPGPDRRDGAAAPSAGAAPSPAASYRRPRARRPARDREGEPMSEFLSSVKADLLDRRLLPLVVAGGARAGGRGRLRRARRRLERRARRRAPARQRRRSPRSSGVAISQANPEKAVAETTGGASDQRRARRTTRSPRCPKPKAKAAASTTTTTTTAPRSTSASSSSIGLGSSLASSGGSASPTPVHARPRRPSRRPSTTWRCCSACCPPARPRRPRS